MSYKLFLDDLRDAEAVYNNSYDKFIAVRNYDDLINCIKIRGIPLFICFYYDLGVDTIGNILHDGYVCAKWLVYESNLDIRDIQFSVHSANPVARVQIQSLLDNYIKFLKNNQPG